MSDFVGSGHIALVDMLVDRLADIREGKRCPRVVVLEAESGAGKSRIIREFYERLRLGQSNGNGAGYWPPLTAGRTVDDSETDLLGMRKVIGPSIQGFQRPEGAFPEYTWLSVNCAEGEDGSFVEVTQLLWPALRQHLRFLVYGWKRSTTTKTRLLQWWSDYRGETAPALAQIASTEALNLALTSMGVPGPLAALLLDRLGRMPGAVSSSREIRKAIKHGGTLDIDQEFDPDRLAAELLRIVSPGMPLVLAVEDLHLMDPTLGELIDRLGEHDPDRPVLVVCTAWPEGISKPEYRAWRKVATTALESVQIVDGTSFPCLAVSDLVHIASVYLPASPAQDLTRLAESRPNPYLLKLLLTDRAFKRKYVVDGRLAPGFDPHAAPKSIRDLYSRRFGYLPEAVQDALMLAAGSLPDNAPDLLPYLPHVVARASMAVGLDQDSQGLIQSLRAAVDQYQWCVQVASGLEAAQFRELGLQSVAAMEFAQSQGDDRDVFRDALIEALETPFLLRAEDQPENGLSIAARWLLALDPPDTEATSLAAWWLAKAAAKTLQPARALELITEQRMALLADEPRRGYEVQASLALWCIADRRFGQALEHIRSAKMFAGALVAGRLPFDMAILEAEALCETLNPWAAIEVLQDVGRQLDQTGITSGPAWDVYQQSLAKALNKAGASDKSLEMLESQIEEQGPVGQDRQLTVFEVQLYNRYAIALSNAGRHEESARVLDMVVARCPIPMNSQQGLALRSNWASELVAVDDPRGRRELQVVVADRTRLLGEDHPQTLWSTVSLAKSLLQDGDPDGLPLLRRVFDVQEGCQSRTDLVTTGYLLITSMGAKAPESLEIARRMARCGRPDADELDIEATAKQLIAVITDQMSDRPEECIREAIVKARSCHDYEESTRLAEQYLELLRARDAPEDDILIARLIWLTSYAQTVGSRSSTVPGLDEEVSRGLLEGRDLVRELTGRMGASGTQTLSARGAQTIILSRGLRFKSAREELRRLVPVMERSGHPELPLAAERLRKLDALWDLRATLTEISDETHSSTEDAAERLLDALETLVTNSTDLHRSYSDDVRRQVLIAKGMSKTSPQSAAKSLRRVCKVMRQHLEENFSR